MTECGALPTAACGPFHSVLTACLWPPTGGEVSAILTLPACLPSELALILGD